MGYMPWAALEYPKKQNEREVGKGEEHIWNVYDLHEYIYSLYTCTLMFDSTNLSHTFYSG